MEYPKLRNIEAFPVKMQGQDLICFRDPQRITESIVFLPRSAYFIVSLFDGGHSILDIQAKYMRIFGELIYRDQIIEVMEKLDQSLLLDSDRFREYRNKLEEESFQTSIRKPMLAGGGYESVPEKLCMQIESFYFLEGGPGQGPHPQVSVNGLLGFIAPHIDYMRGGHCYAWAYKEVAEHSDHDVFILLGTSHLPTQKYFVLTKKDFETPFGILKTDRDILSRLENDVGRNFFIDEFVHRSEHSLELQTVYLHNLFGKNPNLRIVPILCGSFYEIISRGGHPRESEELNGFIEALGKTICDDGRKICLVASADLAHVGRQFGHQFVVSESVMADIKRKDMEMLNWVLKGDADGFFNYILKERDQRNICGLPPIYALLRLLENSEGKLLNYSQWKDPAGNGAVTFASIVFH
ncbi:MAG: AmmeMemoRadiSam system protein B [Thermodesulfobacteriota bacterium]|jgi:AmmeMemoRadiSam system protein B|nr:MAG: AmmeMemoRadiSam system protein B [Thermodesulfobacteriota bacterium]